MRSASGIGARIRYCAPSQPVYNLGMVLSSQEESLICVIRALPPDEAGKVLNWARHLTELAEGQNLEWSDSWSSEDLADATKSSLRRFEDGERDNL